jgi:hypothetical protein
MPQKTNSEVPCSQSSGVFHGGQDVDIEGVTGSIPVTPTIRSPANQGLGQSGAKCPTGSSEPRTAGSQIYIYRWNRKDRKGQRCVVTARGTMNSCCVRFDDGYQMVTSRNALMKAKPAQSSGL